MHNPTNFDGQCVELRLSEEWCNYFQANAESLLEIPWERGGELPDVNRQSITHSLQEFQLGEHAEGRHLFRCAQAHAQQTGDSAYTDAVRLFIAEEQRHARDLGRFLTLAGVPLLERSWPETIFHWLRHRAGLELSIRVLIVAEIIALVYFRTVREASTSAVLRRLCEQILHDEVEHVRFQAERLAILRRGRGWLPLAGAHALQRFLFLGTCLVVWWRHRRAMRAGGFGFGRFWREAWKEMNSAIRMMDPRTYVRVSSARESNVAA